MIHLYTFVTIVNGFQKPYNYSEMFGYIVKGNLNIRICRDITGLPDLPDYVIQAGEQFGGLDVVWGGVDVNNYHGKKLGGVLKLKRKS